jgi:regulator of sigma E protease
MYYSGVPLGGPQGVEALGIAYEVTNEVQGVVRGGPADQAGLQPGDRIMAAKIVYPNDKKGKKVKPLTLKLTDDEGSWPGVVDAVQFADPATTVTFTVAGANTTDTRDVPVKPTAVTNAYYAPRGFIFEPIRKTRTAETFAQQVQYGWEETSNALTMVVRFLRKLGTKQVPITMLGGPGTIAAAAGQHASEGLSSLLIFLTMLSANLAVINFLPIPILDGGHMVFLAYEGLRGRPANERVVVALHAAGFVFILGLMLFVIGLDIKRWILT